MRRALLLLPVALTATLVAGCGSTAGGSKASTASAISKPSLSALAQVQAASDASAGAGSSRIALLSTSTVDGKDVTVKADGVFDRGRKLGQLTLNLGQAGGQALSIEERFLGNDLYVTVPQQPGTFYKLALPDLVGTSLASSSDPTAGFAALKAASSDVSAVGKEKVREAETTHYKGTYDVKAATAKLQGAALQSFQSALQGSDLSAVPFDAYIDAAGRVRKFVQSLTLTAQGKQVHSTSTIEAYDYGTPVTVTAPAAAQVKDGAPLLAALKGNG